tara:strand:- start:92 stop:322 length:231 start_codon:yes stop_codon:yes gene_type:complete
MHQEKKQLNTFFLCTSFNTHVRVQYVRVQYAPAPLALHPSKALLQLLDFSVQLVGKIEPSLFLVAGLAHELRVPVV